MKSKLPGTGTSIFAVMSKMAVEYNALNLSQGFPDFNCSPALTEIVSEYLKKGYNQYAPMPGILPLREVISEKIFSISGFRYNPETEITITAGATQALYTAITSIVTPGDEVILFEPAYDSYAPAIQLNGGIPVYISMTPDCRIDFNRLKDSISDKTKLIIINSPHNPGGSVLTYDEIKCFEEIIGEKDILIVSDEVYEHITFDSKKHISFASSEILREKTFVISSFGKTFHTTGWKIGYCCSPASLMSEFRKIHQFIVFAVNTPIQYAYSDFLKIPEHYLGLNDFYQAKRNVFLEGIKNSRLRYIPAEGTYFQLLDYAAISDMSDMDFAFSLTKEHGIAVIPLSPFYSEDSGYDGRIIRICFAKKDDMLQKAGELLSSLDSVKK